MRMKKALCLLTILCFLSVALPSQADKEYLYPTSDSGGTWSSSGANIWSVIDDDRLSISDSDYAFVATKIDNHDGGMGNTSIGGSDTINYVIMYLRAKEDGGPENVKAWIKHDGSDCSSVTITNTAFTDTNTGQMSNNCAAGSWTTTNLDALEWHLQSTASGKNDGTNWVASSLYIEVDYTPAAGGDSIFYVTKKKIFNVLKFLKIVPKDYVIREDREHDWEEFARIDPPDFENMTEPLLE